ncbi:MAG: aspartate aminotransferase family protein [Candidatus Bathyarchaeia archaeon]
MSGWIVDTETHTMASTYWKRPLVITHGQGASLWDAEGREYLDCTSNYGVAITGHCHPRVVEAIRKQAGLLLSCHGTFYNEARSGLLERLSTIAPDGLKRAFLSNSGTEAIEFALKLARRSTGKTGIIAMMGAFHGKTMGALSATWNKKYRTPFMPLVPGFSHVPYGRLERVEAAIDDETAAIIAEPIQGESGVNVPPDDFLPGLRDICDDKGVLLILDEIQTGFGRTGDMFACQHSGIEPDILCLAKAIASGLPMGATMATEEVMSKLKMGDHSSTFGGGPVACAAACATLDVLKDERLPERAKTNGDYMFSKLEGLAEKYRIVRGARGRGLMLGLDLRFDVLNIIMGSLERGVLFLDAGRNVVRMLPPLIIDREEIDRAITVLDEVIEVEENARLSG